LPGDEVICDASTGAFVVTLPAAAAGLRLAIRKSDSTPNAVVITAAGSDTIGIVNAVAAIRVLTPGGVVDLIGIAGGWAIASAPINPDAWLGFAATLAVPGVAATTVGVGTYFARVTRGQAPLASKIGVVITTSSGNISVGAYRNSGSGRSAAPGTQLAGTGSIACPAAGYQEIALGTTVDIGPGDWLAVAIDGTTQKMAIQTLSNNISPYAARQATSGFPVPSTVGTLISPALMPELYAIP
jgi:hypothetical protein